MGDKITEISERQLRLFRRWQKKWVETGFSTERANRPRAEAGYEGLYQAAGLQWPGQVVWVRSPFVAGLAGPVAFFLIELHKSGCLTEVVHQEVLRLTRLVVASEVEGPVNKKVLPALQQGVLDAIDAAIQAVIGTKQYADACGDVTVARVAVDSNRVPGLIVKTLKRFRREGVASQVDEEVLLLLHRNVQGDPGRLLENPCYDEFPRGRFSIISAPIWHQRRDAYLERDIARMALQEGREARAALMRVGEAFRSLLGWYQPMLDGQLGILDAFFSRFLVAVCGLELSLRDLDTLDSLTAVADSGSAWYPCSHFVMASERPKTLDLTVIPDDSGSGRAGVLLSNETAPVASWSDGWGVYVVRDVHIPYFRRHVVEGPEMITRREVEDEADEDLRVVMAQQSVYGAPFSYRKQINQALSKVERKTPARIFLQANRVPDGWGGIRCWFEIPLTDTFVDRIRYLKELRRAENLWSIEELCSLPWMHLPKEMVCVADLMSVNQWSISFKAMLDRRICDQHQKRYASLHSQHPPQVVVHLEAVWTFPSIDDYLVESHGEPFDYLVITGDERNDQQFREFYRQVSSHLAVQYLKPLRLTKQDLDRSRSAECMPG